MPFNLDLFERHVHRREYEPAARELLALLHTLDANYGATGDGFRAQLTGEFRADELNDHLTTRIAAATGFLFSDENFQLSPEGLSQLLNWQRWMSTLFAASPFRNADAILRALNGASPNDPDRLVIQGKDLHKFCLLYGPESRIPLDLDALWESSPPLAAGLALVLLAPRFLGTPVAHEKRELLLPWLARRLPEIEDLDVLPTGILHDVYMHCSYADRVDKHDIKKGINALIHRKLEAKGIYPLKPPAPPVDGTKPVLMVVLEWFNASHSIYRTHSRTLEAARERFTVIGLGHGFVDRAGREVFDEFIEIPATGLYEQLNFLRDTARAKGAHALYMPSVGMHALTMFLANVRLAPVQAMALGHPATSHSEEMDYVVVEQDYVGDPACFSEELLVLPSDGMPYRPSSAAKQLALPPRRPDFPETVHVAIAATTMKLNPGFMAACKQIADQVAKPVHFHFMAGQAVGWVYIQVARLVKHYLGDRATVHPHAAYDEYMKRIASCDLFLNPFPFGNTNGIIDTITAGLVGVCKTGREVHEHIDQGMFERIGLPPWMVAKTVDDYVKAAVRLIGNDEERVALAREFAGPQAVEKYFFGRPEIFGQLLLEKVNSALGRPAKSASLVPSLEEAATH
jgi:HMW1C N-terminal/HMW1 domain 2